MDRLTWKRNLDGFSDLGLRDGVTVGDATCRLADYEDTGLEPEEISEVQKALEPIPFRRFRDIMEAERAGRLVILTPNIPLIPDELRQMAGEPVFIKCLFNADLSRYVIIDLCNNGIFTKSFFADFEYYGDEWLAYRRKPEEDEP